ncbi:MAG: ATP phosphoribosyltransferase regulatory subunit [Burkholderiaceae bacterium]|jgi:ATP phosphoribosyltransferase regulatory subunit|nr:ATP phosphoribosyltransferase regulatory subunit [Burkholderiales bacterium]MCA3214685.1 ATP phosphoribosyltransferase regulatory subunit [Burkholderiales bacterium]MCE2644597.1 ATP phosphoribosyltransferase regulatory subunit [Burkholderiaceae bacterium]
MARWLLPEGISDTLPAEAQHIESLRRRLLDLYRVHGYELVIPPLIEYLDSLLTGTGRDLDLRTFKLVDQLSGRQLGLRADITPQTARIDAHILNRRGVVRLCYAGSVLHTRPAHPLATRQPVQVGAELYGHASLAADLEVQRLALESLRLAGLTDIRMDFGHTGVVRALLAADPAAQPLADDLLAALGAKDRAALRVLAAQLAPATARALDVLVTLHGAPAAVLAQAREQLPAMPAIARALDDLAELTAAVVADAVSIDLSDLHGYRYYTGVNFAAYSRTAGLQGAVLRGGRYDDIGRAFGRARAATGFSIDLRELARVDVATDAAAVLAPAGQDAALRAKVAELRAAGEVVVQQLDASDVPETFEFARELKLVNGRWCVQSRGR